MPGTEPEDKTEKAKKARAEAGKVSAKPAPADLDPQIRAENEDDDGYDPYSDRRSYAEPLFQPDPWD